METVSMILLVTSLLLLAAAVLTALAQILKDGLKGLKPMPAGLLLALYVVTYAVWLVL